MTVCCELEDGTFILDSKEEFQRWDLSKEIALQTFTGHEHRISDVIELKSDVVLSVSEDELIIWRVSTGECLHKLTNLPDIMGLVKLSDGFFATGSGFKIGLWNEHGYNYATYITESEIQSMIILTDGSIVTRECGDYSGYYAYDHLLLTIVKQ